MHKNIRQYQRIMAKYENKMYSIQCHFCYKIRQCISTNLLDNDMHVSDVTFT